MKKIIVCGVMAFCFLPLAFAQEKAAEKPKEFVVYTDKNARENHFIASGWMGDNNSADAKGTKGDIFMDEQSMDNPHSGTTCLKFIFTAKKTKGKGWSGIYWQNPSDNWGDKNGGFDLSGMTKLTFWVRGAKGGEVIRFKVGGIGIRENKPYPDSVEVETEPIELTDTWKQYTINLAGRDLSYVSGGFCWVASADLNPEGATFYLDDIKFEVDTAMKPEVKKQEAMPFYVYSDSRSPKNHFVPSGWMPGLGTDKDIKYEGSCKEDPYLGDTCIKIQYKDVSGNRWGGIYWLHPSTPVNDWGKYDVGYDLSKATKFTFWARGEKGGERIETFKVGGVTAGPYSDSDGAEIGPIILNKVWTQYTVDLRGKDMSYINGGFCWSTNIDVNPEGVTFYLDEMKYE
jgi:hypothetical protein